MLNACHSCRHFASEASPCLLCLPILLLELLFSSYPLVCLKTLWPWTSSLAASFHHSGSLPPALIVLLLISAPPCCFSESLTLHLFFSPLLPCIFLLIFFSICGSCGHQRVDNPQRDLSKIYGIPGAHGQLLLEHHSAGFSNLTCLNILISSLWVLSHPQPPTGNCAWSPSSVQFTRSVMTDSLRLHGLQHARPPCPSPTPGACSNSHPSSRWCHPTISSSVVPFSCLQSVNNVFLILISKAQTLKPFLDKCSLISFVYNCPEIIHKLFFKGLGPMFLGV